MPPRAGQVPVRKQKNPYTEFALPQPIFPHLFSLMYCTLDFNFSLQCWKYPRFSEKTLHG